MQRRSFIGIAAIAAASVTLTLFAGTLSGCGGSGSSMSAGRATSPSATTRAQVQTMHKTMFRSFTNSGVQSLKTAQSLNSGIANGSGTTGGSGGNTTVATNSNGSVPMIGAYLRNVAAPKKSRAAYLRVTRAMKTGITRDDLIPVDPFGDYDYYDYYLGLYVHVHTSGAGTVSTLFEDEAHTLPAGNITSEYPADNGVYPQTYKSSYQFLKGYSAGSSGSSTSIYQADGSNTSDYSNIYADGSKDAGKSSYLPDGTATWYSRTSFATGGYTESRGTFRSDGSGGTSNTEVDAKGNTIYSADYVFNSDGSGHGTIKGNDAGLPATIDWDAYGNTTIRYADGTVEHISGWGSSDDTSGGTGTTGSGTTGDGNTSGGTTGSGTTYSNTSGGTTTGSGTTGVGTSGSGTTGSGDSGSGTTGGTPPPPPKY